MKTLKTKAFAALTALTMMTACENNIRDDVPVPTPGSTDVGALTDSESKKQDTASVPTPEPTDVVRPTEDACSGADCDEIAKKVITEKVAAMGMCLAEVSSMAIGLVNNQTVYMPGKVEEDDFGYRQSIAEFFGPKQLFWLGTYDLSVTRRLVKKGSAITVTLDAIRMPEQPAALPFSLDDYGRLGGPYAALQCAVDAGIELPKDGVQASGPGSYYNPYTKIDYLKLENN